MGTRRKLAALIAGAVIVLAGSTSHGAEVLYSGTLWVKRASAIEGQFRIIENEGRRTLVLSDGFETKSAPDLKLVLSPHELEKSTKKNALEGGLILAPLKSNTGAQTYEIPADTDLSRYRSLLIHCERYTKLWGGVALDEGEVVAASGDWVKKTKRTRGRYEIVRTDSGLVLRFGEGFKTAKPPESLRIVLSRHSPTGAQNDNAMDDGLVVAELREISGAQEYVLPEGVDLSAYDSLLLHCERYTKLWSAASLTSAD